MQTATTATTAAARGPMQEKKTVRKKLLSHRGSPLGRLPMQRSGSGRGPEADGVKQDEAGLQQRWARRRVAVNMFRRGGVPRTFV